jgi:hypothetical protein
MFTPRHVKTLIGVFEGGRLVNRRQPVFLAWGGLIVIVARYKCPNFANYKKREKRISYFIAPF